jgi:hypothetical protein
MTATYKYTTRDSVYFHDDERWEDLNEKRLYKKMCLMQTKL